MALIVKRIPRELSYNSLYDYFSKFGRINDFRIRNDFATLQYDSFSSEKDAHNASHEINGFRLYIETDENNNAFVKCSHCPVHCNGNTIREKPIFEDHNRQKNFANFGHPLDIYKIVLSNIPDCNVMEIKDYVRSLDLDPVYARITQSGQHGIVEFKSIEAKNNAMRVLEGAIFKNLKLSCRPYFNRERREHHDDGFRNKDFSGFSSRSSYSRDERMSEKDHIQEKEEVCEDLKDWNKNLNSSSAK